VLVQIGTENTRHIFRDMPADTAFFLGHASSMDHAATCHSGTSYAANLRHNKGAQGAARHATGQANVERGAARVVKRNSRSTLRPAGRTIFFLDDDAEA
jgi:hypothetical protein